MWRSIVGLNTLGLFPVIFIMSILLLHTLSTSNSKNDERGAPECAYGGKELKFVKHIDLTNKTYLPMIAAN